MRVSLNWIARLLGRETLPVDADSLVQELTVHLAEIDEVERTGPELGDRVVVGKVLSCSAHPDADRLSLTSVDVGAEEPIPVVCGAPNVAAGQTVAVALPGARLTVIGKDGEPTELKIKKGKVRGQASHGMICAEDELGLGSDHSGILVLDDHHPAGTPVDAAIGAGDTVLVVDNHNINHRPDLWGHLGWAREIAAICDLPAPAEPDLAWQDDDSAPVSVAITDERCRCYCGAVVAGVANGPSPAWLQDLLVAAGLRPRGLLVDVTNYVMLELGEPMHAFDRRQIRGDRITVRSATAGDELTTLDGQVLDLDGEDLLIADAERPVALAGIMGGADSGIAADTDCIVLEAAVFAAAGIRRSRIRHGLATDSSNRFEKGLYPAGAIAAINRAIVILREAHPDCQVLGRFSAGEPQPQPRLLPYRSTDLERFVGMRLEEEAQWRLLERLGITAADGQASIPWYRQKDLEAPIDLVEEVARLHGYEHIQQQVPRMPAAAPQDNPLRRAEHRCRQLLSALGWDEVATYCFTSEAWATALGWPADQAIRLQHPLSSDMTVMRAGLLPNLAEAVARNRRFLADIACYEVGKVYGRSAGSGSCAHERLQVAGIHAAEGCDTPFYAARDAALAVLAGLGHPAIVTPLTGDAELQDGRAAELRCGDRVVGRVGELPGPLRQLAGCPEATAAFVIELEQLLAELPRPTPHAFVATSRFQAVERDFTFVCPESLSYGELADWAMRSAGDLGRGTALAQDIYRGDGIPAEHKAISLRITLQADDRTLSDKELGTVSNRIVKTIENRTPARLRA